MCVATLKNINHDENVNKLSDKQINIRKSVTNTYFLNISNIPYSFKKNMD